MGIQICKTPKWIKKITERHKTAANTQSTTTETPKNHNITKGSKESYKNNRETLNNHKQTQNGCKYTKLLQNNKHFESTTLRKGSFLSRQYLLLREQYFLYIFFVFFVVVICTLRSYFIVIFSILGASYLALYLASYFKHRFAEEEHLHTKFNYSLNIYCVF